MTTSGFNPIRFINRMDEDEKDDDDEDDENEDEE